MKNKTSYQSLKHILQKRGYEIIVLNNNVHYLVKDYSLLKKLQRYAAIYGGISVSGNGYGTGVIILNLPYNESRKRSNLY